MRHPTDKPWPVQAPTPERMDANATRVMGWPWWSEDENEVTCLRKLESDTAAIRAEESEPRRRRAA